MMKTTDDLVPEFADAQGIRAIFGLKRSLLYELMGDGLIRSTTTRRKNATRGKRLFQVQSVRDYLNSQMDGGPAKAASAT